MENVNIPFNVRDASISTAWAEKCNSLISTDFAPEAVATRKLYMGWLLFIIYENGKDLCEFCEETQKCMYKSNMTISLIFQDQHDTKNRYFDCVSRILRNFVKKVQFRSDIDLKII